MRWGPRAWFGVAFVVFATLAIILLVLRPAVAWAAPDPATGAKAAPTLVCESPWERMTASPSALIRSADESGFPGDRCGAAIADRQELASGAALGAGVFALFFAATMFPRARSRPLGAARGRHPDQLAVKAARSST